MICDKFQDRIRLTPLSRIKARFGVRDLSSLFQNHYQTFILAKSVTDDDFEIQLL